LSIVLVSTAGSLPEQEVVVPEDSTIGEAIGFVFGEKLRNQRFLLEKQPGHGRGEAPRNRNWHGLGRAHPVSSV